MNKYERLINLVLALYATERPLTRADIFGRINGYEGSAESMRRAFERDKEELRNLGIPLLTTGAGGDGDEVGYRIDREQYEVSGVDFEADELTAMHVALATVQLKGTKNPESALWKLGGALAGDQSAVQPNVSLEVDAGLATLFAATNERRVVTFLYRGEERHVEPRGLAFRSGHWYLSGFDQDRQGVRNFRRDRIESEPVAGSAGAFARPEGPPPRPVRPWEMGEGEPVLTRVLVDPDLATWVEQDLGSDAIEERRPDGSVVIVLSVSSVPGLRSFVLGFLARAEVIDPPEMRAGMVEWLEAMA